MFKRIRISFFAIFIVFTVLSAFSYCLSANAQESEMRGVWVPSIANIDYPSNPTTDPEVLKAEFVTILDNCEKMGFNTIFFQVRPCSDALYKSSLYPWSRYLTGKQGQAPDDDFDPLQFAVTEAHKRGIELHAWINPYRVTNTQAEREKLSDQNPALIHPELIMTDSEGKMYFDPANMDAVDFIVDGAAEIVRNYDVDGLHIDDYFYPSNSFDDSDNYARLGSDFDNVSDWRRSNVNKLIQKLDETLHSIKSDIKFGVGVTGIWANKTEMPGGSDTSSANGSYERVYADSKKWIEEGWVDYIIPEVYWRIGHKITDYSVLNNWWADVAKGTDVKVYIGEAAYRTNVESSDPEWYIASGTTELKNHIQMCRNNPGISGFCFYRYSDFVLNPALFTMIQKLNGLYTGFDDMDGFEWAEYAADVLSKADIMRGKDDKNFSPGIYASRADFISALIRAFGKSEPFDDNFCDISENEYYYNDIGIAKQMGIATGMGDNKFDPDGNIRRQDIAALIYRIFEYENMIGTYPGTSVADGFSDSDQISDYAKEAVAFCIQKGFIKGFDDGTVKPRSYARRAEVAVIIQRICNIYKK